MKFYPSMQALLYSAMFSSTCFSQTGNSDPYSDQADTNDQCTSTLTIGETITSEWESACSSDRRTSYYDPYAPPVSYLAKYFTFQVTEDMDVQITLNDSEPSSNFYLLNGSRGGSVITSTTQQHTAFLSAGTYTLEVTNENIANFSISVNQVNQSGGDCSFDILDNQTVTGSFSTDCLSERRSDDYVDPYASTGSNFRAKYYTFDLPGNSDVRFNVSGNQVDTYLYLLSGGDKNGSMISSHANSKFLSELSSGTYTVEVTTDYPDTFGNFNASLEVLGDNTVCEKSIELGEFINDEFSPNCLLVEEPSYDYGDPYAPSQSSVRANYYALSLDELSEIRLNSTSNDIAPLVNIFSDSGEKLFTNQPASYWSSPENPIYFTLQEGDYAIEVTAYDELAIGAFTLKTTELEASNCVNNISLSESQEGLLTERCLSQFRGLEGGNSDPYSGMQDPYAPAPGDYYSKAFEFELTEPTSIRFSATQNNYSTYLYLAQQDEEQSDLLSQTELEYQWGDRYEELERHLAPGKYLAEVTTINKEQDATFTASLSELPVTSCESYVIVDEAAELEIGANEECDSQQKPTQTYYDPYASPPSYKDVYYASYNTFKVTEQGEYRIATSDASISVDFFYTTETTTEFPNEKGDVTLLVERVDIYQCQPRRRYRRWFFSGE